MSNTTNVLILAAGLGTRMKSDQAKVLHKLGGQPLIAHVVRSASVLNPEKIIVVIGHQAEKVEAAARASLPPEMAERLVFVMQTEQRGTGHAVMCAREVLKNARGSLIVSYGDAPLVKADTLRKLIAEHESGQHAATLITIKMEIPPAYGRIIRDSENQFVKIVEDKDCTPEQKQIKEVNPGFYCFDIQTLLPALDRLTTHNAQGEYYLTDVPEILRADGKSVGTVLHDDYMELQGFNNRAEIALGWKKLRGEILQKLMADGVTIVDPDSTYIDVDVEIGRDTTIHPQVIIEGRSHIGSNCEIHSWSHLTNVEIGDNCTVNNSCVLEDSKLTANNTVGPFARLRMHAVLDDSAVVGNFVELKKSKLGRKSKSMHLTYLGDATIGDRVNIGAATVTCNYDGKNKHQTIIEDDVKIGSDTMLVAPVKVGRGAVSGAGSVIIEDVPEDSLVAGVPAKVKKKLK
ncbi:MAG: bifunctional UDP-N-acetylglucosamine diphosphorylase/glucosamine-1-phosphate N-acetyltransferase GlmU [Acidobacteria bacterium]|nr:bifunctional UDP-N-acetylglucosamine diphosphorylase/glucosamine-1-phosphate N-acetyltransferase GlmU [Acidobacteriota bacterium]